MTEPDTRYLPPNEWDILKKKLKIETWEEFRKWITSNLLTPLLNGMCIWKTNIQCPIMLVYPDLKDFQNRKELKDYCKMCELRKGISYSQATMTETSAKAWVGEHFHTPKQETPKYTPEKPKQFCESCGSEQVEFFCVNSNIKLCELCSHEHIEFKHNVVRLE